MTESRPAQGSPPGGTPIDLAKLRSIGVISRRSRDRVSEGRDSEGKRWKATKDQLGNVVTERHGDRQDVTINAPKLVAETAVREERS